MDPSELAGVDVAAPPDPAPLLAQLLPPGVAWRSVALGLVGQAGLAGEACEMCEGGARLYPQEAAAVAHAVPRRRREFGAGRQAAHEALAALGVAPQPVPAAADRSPVWPTGVVGSISHDEHHAVAAVAHSSRWRALGIDMDLIHRFSASLQDTICTPDERRRLLAGANPATAQRHLALLFCVKEAVYKAQYPLTTAWLDFADLEVALPAQSGGLFVATLQRDAGGMRHGHRFEGRCGWDEARCAAALLLPAEGDSAATGPGSGSGN